MSLPCIFLPPYSPHPLQVTSCMVFRLLIYCFFFFFFCRDAGVCMIHYTKGSIIRLLLCIVLLVTPRCLWEIASWKFIVMVLVLFYSCMEVRKQQWAGDSERERERKREGHTQKERGLLLYDVRIWGKRMSKKHLGGLWGLILCISQPLRKLQRKAAFLFYRVCHFAEVDMKV